MAFRDSATSKAPSPTVPFRVLHVGGNGFRWFGHNKLVVADGPNSHNEVSHTISAVSTLTLW
jgi:hypothetical protein